jgi:hypothetical protein
MVVNVNMVANAVVTVTVLGGLKWIPTVEPEVITGSVSHSDVDPHTHTHNITFVSTIYFKINQSFNFFSFKLLSFDGSCGNTVLIIINKKF